ncbi:MAG: Asp-tRNA(Asn)/Glu-tRNA(Gln) amidotransferase subunit GatA [Acidobacteriota bacterium]|nr:Asp-tRNA(Asn)/Glu-tRNA(Gln) amidotransferase subunit GatA [Acidobacteriota bacterium]
MSEIKSNVKKSLDNAEKLNETLNSFLKIEREYALNRAEDLEKSSDESLLKGISIAVKDNICTKFSQTSCGSRILGNYRPQYNATAVDKLLKAGAVIIGKTNMDEFAMGSSNENSAFGTVKNPWDTSRVPGGSSGGSAVAVASGVVRAALGSETGGSVRQPASFCGIVGLKPTYGRISRFGLVAFASSLDQIGIFGQTSKDVAEVLQVISGRDAHDSTTADVEVPSYADEIGKDIKGKRIGVPRALFGEGLDDEVRNAVEQSIENYRSLGAEIIDIDLPNSKYSIAVYYIIATAEASSNLARFDGVRYGFRAENAHQLREMYMKTREEGFGEEVKRRIMLGTYVLSSGYYDAYYAKAQKVRTLLKQDFLSAFDRCDAILTPTAPTVAFKIGEKSDDPLAMYLSDIYTASANLVGIPGISVPCGLSSEGLPIGLQLVGNHWSEAVLLNLANAYESQFPLGARARFSVAD